MSRDDFDSAVRGLAAIALFAIAIVGVPASARPYVLALTSFIALIWRRREGVPLRDPIQGLAVAGLIGAVVWFVVIAVSDDGEENRSAPDPQHEASPGEVLRVYNKVTSGAHRMRENYPVVYLTTKPVGFCSKRGCNISATKRETGDTYDAAVCRRKGEDLTNGHDTDPADNRNPHIFASPWYYGVRLEDGTFGYVNEVWIHRDDRGGLGLPRC